MTLRASIATVVSCATFFLLAASSAKAITLPDSGTCAAASGSACLDIGNTSNGTAINATGNSVAINAQSAGYGVYATSTNYIAVYAFSPATNQPTIYGAAYSGQGVYGHATGGTGVYGQSGSGTGVYGESQANAPGVHGVSLNGSGVYAVSSYGNGLVAANNDTTQAAAAVSALAGNSSGLAYWGTGSIIVTGNAYKPGGGSWQAYSDLRLKKEVSPLRLGLEQLRQVRPVTYKYNGLGGTADDGHEYVGVIAQELEKIFPGMVTTRKGKLHESDAAQTDLKVVDPSALTYVLINAVKEQQQIIDRQERRLASLERGRSASLSALGLGGGVETGLALGLLPLGLVLLRKRKETKVVSRAD